ncbi:hypothetical protein KM295_06980 [Natronomonas sp. F2-12]|jgi:hypothetical protein|uniref:Uncharacterized protein n=1 Tax=Natronomonas aquatica TaxID=2841590 RepID=A0A9R1CSK5_9EURY|nr:hypothetical protein [Natronomonas aquatica]MCQ4333227.1 hypothetical protein [Natronomonas aquatica]
MAVHGTRDAGAGLATLPEVVPFEIPHLSRLSWELGSRVIEGTESVHAGEWRHARGRWRLSVFEVTDNTVLIRVRTSVGRERFYDAMQSELESALPAIEASASWRRIE